MSAVDGRNVITLCDIYHIATDLRHEFERLMASYGPEKFSLLVPPVVQCLELLECQMEAQHRDTAQIQDLRNYVDLLQTEKHSSALLKEKYEKVKMCIFLLHSDVNVAYEYYNLQCERLSTVHVHLVHKITSLTLAETSY